MTKWIWLDMDGTFVNFYNVNGWLADLIAENTRPYEVAEPLYNMAELINALEQLKENGFNIGIISWGSKGATDNFNKAVTIAKRNWIKKYQMNKIIDKMIVTPYGIKKADTCKKFGFGILVDDEKQNRDNWNLGNTINANNNIIKKLLKLI